MNLENTVEVTAESVDEAIRKGLEQLAAMPYEVIVEVLEEPNESFYGESRQAKVRLKRLSAPKPPMDPAAFSAAPVVESPIIFDRLPDRPVSDIVLPPERREKPASPPRKEGSAEPGRSARADRDKREGSGKPREGGRDRRDGRSGGQRSKDERPKLDEPSFAALVKDDLPPNADYGVTDDEAPMFLVAAIVPEHEQDDEAQIGKVVLETLLENMELRPTIEVRRAPQHDEEAAPWVLNITGTRVGDRLVGRRGETLAALQYLTRLIASRELQRRAELIVDVDGYKAKRAATLRTMAERMADDAVKNTRVITLEPMPPHERRIIHLALREREDVSTRSIGEGRNRKVTIVPTNLPPAGAG